MFDDYVEKTQRSEPIVVKHDDTIEESEMLDKEKDAIESLLSSDDDDVSNIKIHGGHLLVKYVQRNDEPKYSRTPSGLFKPLNMNKINNKLDVGKILAIGSIYNYTNNIWIEFKDFDFFHLNDIILFEKVSWTPFTDELCFVPFDSVRANLGNMVDKDQLAEILAKTAQNP